MAVMPADVPSGLLDVIARHWGFRALRPLQARAMRAALAGRDSLCVLPTGGGKSLCYQAPAVFAGGLTVVISPLIALMKDQVDRLVQVGVPAARLDSSQTPAERTAAGKLVASGTCRLLFVSPERLALDGFAERLRARGIHSLAIDECHCISQWGHDFRPEYRQLFRLRELFPGVAVHAYTATATPQVRDDIVHQLGLVEPDVIVGDFDRANLTYRVLPRLDRLQQVRQVIDRHPGGAGIVYCLRRKDVEEVAAGLTKQGVRAIGYHAGMDMAARRHAQEQFANGDVDVVAATVAFGMGIDRSDVRFVVHVGMPKSLEHYQQETGRAGRDGEPSECVLLHSGSDVPTLKSMILKSAAEAGAGGEAFVPSALRHLEDMDRYARGAVCRHKALARYFGQDYPHPSCTACDLCLGDIQEVPDGTVVAQKILSCVARVNQGFGVGYVVSVLRGENSTLVQQRGHHALSVFGLLQGTPAATLRDWVYQLVGHELLTQTDGEYPILKLTKAAWDVMKGGRPVRLVQVARQERGKRRAEGRTAEVSPADAGVFDALRACRRTLADREGVPPFLVLPDVTLRALAQTRPQSLDDMRQVSGIGEVKLANYGAAFLDVLRLYGTRQAALPPADPRPLGANKQKAYDLFRRGTAVADAAAHLGLARSTVAGYLAQFVADERPERIDPWVPPEVYTQVADAADWHGTGRLAPIFDALGGAVGYDDIRLVLAHLGPAVGPRDG
jgi:ATP-dependent DNA helicase RecQ